MKEYELLEVRKITFFSLFIKFWILHDINYFELAYISYLYARKDIQDPSNIQESIIENIAQ